MEVSKSIEKKSAINCGQCVLEKKIYFIMIFPVILNSYYLTTTVCIFSNIYPRINNHKKLNQTNKQITAYTNKNSSAVTIYGSQTTL